MSWFISHYIIVSSYPWLCPHCPPCFDLSWAKTMKFDGGVFCLSFYLILMWFPLRIFWLNRPRVQAGAQADCAAHATAGSGWKKPAIVVTGAIPAWWPSSAVGLVPVLLASRFDWVIVLHISIFPYSAECSRCSVSWCGEFLFWACYCNSNDIPTLGFCRHAHCDRIGHGSTATAL